MKRKIKLPTLLAFLVPFVAAQIILSYFDPPKVFAEKKLKYLYNFSSNCVNAVKVYLAYLWSKSKTDTVSDYKLQTAYVINVWWQYINR